MDTSLFSSLEEMLASPIFPMPESAFNEISLQIYAALADFDGDASISSWNLLVDTVNVMETFVLAGVCEDNENLIADAIRDLEEVGRGYLNTFQWSFPSEKRQSVKSVVLDFLEIAKAVPYRTFIQCHRLTRERIIEQKRKGAEVVTIKPSGKVTC